MKSTKKYLSLVSILLLAMYGTAFAQTDTEAPSTPTGLQVIETHNTAIGISWNESTDNVGVTGYSIYVNGLYHGNSVDNEYLVSGLSLNTSYIIEVSAFDASYNESARSTSINSTTSTSMIAGEVYSGSTPGSSTVYLSGQGINMNTIAVEGLYSFPNLNAGLYSLTAEALTYQVEVYEGEGIWFRFSLDAGLPEVHTSFVSNITGTDAQCGGTADGADILDKGVVWSTSPYITALSEDTVSNGPGEGSFSSLIIERLAPNTVYYIRAFARNSEGFGWGEEYRFYTGCNPIILNEQISHAECGQSNGSISIAHLELDGPYTYNWSGPNAYTASTRDISDLASGDYEITVTDKNSCQTVKSFEITESTSPDINNLTEVTCSGLSFSITPIDETNGIVPAGTTYSWGAPVVTGGLIGGVAGTGQITINGTLINPTNTAQTATYTVTPVSGTCSGADFTVTVTVNPAPAINDLSTTICGGSGFTVTPINGDDGIVPAGTTYSWGTPTVTGGLTGGFAGTGQITINGTLINPTNAAQTATYTIIPVTGTCTGDDFSVSVTVNPTPALKDTTAGPCSGSEFDISPINIFSGIVPVGTTYSWGVPVVTGGLTGGVAEVGQPSINGTLINPTNELQTAIYTVTPSAGSCTGPTSTVTVTVYPTPEIVLDNQTDASCDGCDDGAIDITATGGIPGYNYNWTGPDGFTASTEDVSGLSPGFYTVLVRDTFGCPASMEVEVEVEDPLIVTLTTDYEPNVDVPILGTLRYAMEHANLNPGLDSISFNIPGAGPHVIQPEFNLPHITESIIIDGYSQDGALKATTTTPAVLMIELDGIILIEDDFNSGLTLNAGNCIIRGLMINRFGDNGIHIGPPGGNVIEGNYIGLAQDGTTVRANHDGGIRIMDSPDNTIGGDDPEHRNVLAGDRANNISILLEGSFDNVIQGNYLGVSADGNTKIGDSEFGIRIYDQAHHNTIGPDNLISGQKYAGIQFEYNNPNNNSIIGNYIGTNHDGTNPIPNEWGIRIYNSADNTVGGFVNPVNGQRGPDCNIISGNRGNGIWIEGDGATGNKVVGNFVGLAANGDVLPNGEFGVKIKETNGNIIGGGAIGDGNIISGNGRSGILISFDVSGNGNEIYGNKIGTNHSGNIAVPNQESGIVILESSHNTIGRVHQGNMISGNKGHGIIIWGDSASYNTIQSNEIGMGKDGKADISVPNDYAGIGIYSGSNNMIGGTGFEEGNVISNNRQFGIWIGWEEATQNQVLGNYIGTDDSGTKSMGNGYEEPNGEGAGIKIYQSSGNFIGGSEVGAGNIISNNSKGGIIVNGSVEDDTIFPASNNRILGNLIGTDKTGMIAMGNDVGIQLDTASNNFIGGLLATERNIISGNNSNGIKVSSLYSTQNTIKGNYIGININGNDTIPNDENGVLISGAINNLIGGTDPASRNIISGNGNNGIAIEIAATGDTAAENRIEGNFIGLNTDGDSMIPNQASGVYITGASNIIGGSESGAGNVITGYHDYGIYIQGKGAIANQIQGNIIGLDSSGKIKLGGDEMESYKGGITLHECLNTVIGGNTQNERNIISGNNWGILITSDIVTREVYVGRHRITGNYIGTDITGKDSIGNNRFGVRIQWVSDNVIGSPLQGERNIISGNGRWSIAFHESPYNKAMNNFIGTDITGALAIPNGLGLHISSSDNCQIGGPETGEGNLISANQNFGIQLWGDDDFGPSIGNIIQGNLIGTDITGTKPLGNRLGQYSPGYGIYLAGPVYRTQIGGINPGEGNLIAYNNRHGILMNNEGYPDVSLGPYGYGNSILSNSIHSNGLTGINLYDLVEDTVTANDPLDIDEGPNGFQNFPVLDTVTFSQDQVMIAGSLRSLPGQDFLLQFFVSPEADETGYGEGKTFIGSDTVTVNSSGYTNFHLNYSTSLRNGLVVTATATDTAGNTSEFSNAIGGAQDQQATGANMPMHWVFHEEGIPYITDSSDFLALHRAFDTWEAITASEVAFEYDGPTTQAKAVANDGINLITFMDESYFTTSEVLGLAAKTLMMDDVSGTAEIVDADIVFNPFFTQGSEGFSTDTHTGQYDLQSIATHEIGHTFGMIHSGVLESTMFFSVLENSTEKRSLEEDDIAWASYRYPNIPEFGLTYGFIKGNITYGDDPQLPPLGGAIVVASNTSTGDGIHAYSDKNGDYKIPVPAGNYKVAIEPLDGNVHGYYLTQANISYYIDGITIYTDFPNEFYNGPGEGHLNDNPDEFVPVTVVVADTTGPINLVTNKDVTPPTVMAVTPKRDSVGVSVMTQVFMGFSEQVDINTFADTTCFLTWDDGGSTGEVYGNFVIADNYGRRIGFTPKEYPLEYSTVYTLHVTNGITDLKGNGLNVPVNPYRFTTEAADTTAPTVTDMLPDHGNDTVFTNADFMVFFSEAMDVATTPDGFSVSYNGDQMVQGVYSWSQDLKILTFNPDSFLDEGTEYTVSVTSGLKDLSQNPLAKDSVLIFSTVPQAPPRILYVGPEPDQDSVSLDSPLVIDFSEPIDPQTANANTIQLRLNNTALTGTFEYVYSNSRVVFRPDQLLLPETTYDVLVTDQINDVSDPQLFLEQSVSHQFITAATVEDPFIDYLDPSSGVAGTMVTIGGWGIDPNPDHVKVMFGEKEAAIIYNESTYITTRVPAGATEGMVTIEVNGTLSNEAYFYVPPFNEIPGDEIRRVVGTQAQAEDVEIEPDAAYAYITNSGADVITRLNMVTFQVQSLAVGDMPVQIDIHPNGDMAYVSNHLSHDVSVINLDLMQVVETIAVGVNPYGLVVSPTGDLLYVANTTSQDVIYIDVDPYSGGYDKVVRSVKTNASNTAIDVSPDAGLVLIACEQGILFLITDQDDPAFNTINRTVNTNASASGVEILPDAGLAVAFTEDNYLVVIGIVPGVNYGKIVGKVNTRGSIGDIDISPDGQIIYVTHPLTSEVSVYHIEYTGAPNVDASVNVSVNLELINVIEVDEAPYAIAADPRGERVFIGHYTQDGQVTEIDVSGSIDAILFLEEMIESVIDAIGDREINSKNGGKLLVDLDKTLSRYTSGQLESAIDHLDNFIVRVTKWIDSGDISEDLGNTWLEAAYRIREQLLADLLAQENLKKGTALNGSDSGISAADHAINNKDLIGAQALKLQNQPNPFSGQTRINFEIPEIGRADIPVVMRVFSTNGQVVRTLVHMDMEPGRYSVNWSGSLDEGGLVPDGIYLLELRIPGQRETLTISVIR